MAYLVLVRHGITDWNKAGRWHGLTDIPLNEEGRKEAQKTGLALQDIIFEVCFTSKLKRAKQTLDEIKKVLNIPDLPTYEETALNERDYGQFTGKNKWEVQKQVGEEEFQKIRRSWNYQPAGGESLKQVYERVVPYFKNAILPHLIKGENVLITASGNSLRALVKYLENLTEDKVSKLEFGIAEAYVYGTDQYGKVISKQIRARNLQRGKI
ncbi:2,3-bisphosphoglycerate-dependent phosphoglycerate mutase [Candidatus Daviesbacteria bacterium]|nr:2,3-bisphosphoglycerate-dependent phosphoglycerate mutase [Candidatus Daviesbacteria bacterium]